MKNNYFDIYNDIWNFHKKYSDPVDTDEYWANVVSECDDISEKYDNSDFVCSMLACVIAELESNCKKREGIGGIK